MKHLKGFNEKIQLTSQQANDLELTFMRARVSPKTDKLPLDTLYDILFIECTEEVENLDGDRGKFLCVDLDYSSYVTVHESLSDAISGIDEERFEVSEVQNSLVNLLEWNDTNFQEIENILIDWNIYVENIWAYKK